MLLDILPKKKYRIYYIAVLAYVYILRSEARVSTIETSKSFARLTPLAI